MTNLAHDVSGMDDLTGYFLTTDRIHADEALASLHSQGIARPIVVRRNVRPYAEAIRPTVECETPYSVVLDDDTVLYPGVAHALMDQFREMRKAKPAGFRLNTLVFDEVYQTWEMGGLHLLYTPHLREIGWPDAPHVWFTQLAIAAKKGFVAFRSKIKAGIQKHGSNFDVYQKFYWDQVRANTGQLKADSLPRTVVRARGGTPWLWFGVLGIVDGRRAVATTSKDAEARGPIGETLDFNTLKAGDVRRILRKLGVEGVDD
jgi:hypothetical protein